MKKYFVLFISLVISFVLLNNCNLISYADSSTYEYSTGYSSMRFPVGTTSPDHPPYDIVRAYSGNLVAYKYTINGMTYAKVMSEEYFLDSSSNNKVIRDRYMWTEVNGEWQYEVTTSSDYYFYEDIETEYGGSMEGLVFTNLASAQNYLTTGNYSPSDIYFGDFPEPDIEWESGNAYDGEPNQSIPAPQFTVSGSQSGNITKSVTFLNAEYDSRAQNGRYGLIMFMKWASIDTFYLERQGGLFSKDFKVNYGTQLPWGDLVDLYPVPDKESDIVYCPQAYFFSQETASVNAFESYLEDYPIANRLVHVPADYEEMGGLENSFKTYLSKPSCPYNTIVFQCRYFKKMDNGKFAFGPWSTGTFYPPSQGAIFNVGSYTSSDNGSMTPGYGGGASGESDNPFNDSPGWKQEWGDTNVNYDYGTDPNPQELVNNMNSLFGFVGQVPAFIGQLFTFIPQWLIIFISVAIGLMVAIGVIKLFLG